MLLVSVSEDADRAREAMKPFLAALLSMVPSDPSSPILATTGVDQEVLSRLAAAPVCGPPVDRASRTR